jgi:hypothetical protein
MKPAVMGLSQVPPIVETFPSSTVTVNEQVSGQSSGQVVVIVVADVT